MPVFDPEVVHKCSMKCLGLPKPEMFDTFAQSLAEHYPGVLDFKQPWIYSIAGGAMIQMKLHYASMTEYIMIWGTPIGSEGHSGRHWTRLLGHRHRRRDVVLRRRRVPQAALQARRPCLRRPRPGARDELHRRSVGGGVRAGVIPMSVPFGIAEESLRLLGFPHRHPHPQPLHRPRRPGRRPEVRGPEAAHRLRQQGGPCSHQGADAGAGGQPNPREEHPLVSEEDLRHEEGHRPVLVAQRQHRESGRSHPRRARIRRLFHCYRAHRSNERR